MVAIGILPTLRPSDLTPAALTQSVRYRALSHGLRRVRQEPFAIAIDGPVLTAAAALAATSATAAIVETPTLNVSNTQTQGCSVVNTSTTDIDVSLHLADTNGNDLFCGSATVPPGGIAARDCLNAAGGINRCRVEGTFSSKKSASPSATLRTAAAPISSPAPRR